MRIACTVLIASCATAPVAELHQVGRDVFSLAVPAVESATRIAAPTNATNDQKFAAVLAAMRTELAHAPGAAIAVVIDGQIAYERGFGITRAGMNDPVTPHTLFRVASTTKLVTAVAAMTLVQRGQLDLDAAVPWFTRRAGVAAASVTLRSALTHTSGIPDDNTSACATPLLHLRDYFTARANDPLWSPPGEIYDYSNAGYALVGAAIEVASSMRFDDYVRDAVLRPAGMATATFDLAHVASGHDRNGVLLPRAALDDCTWLHPAGGLVASADDFGHLVETLIRGNLIDAHSLAVTTVPTGDIAGRRYGFGVFTQTRHGVRVFAHPGDIAGYTSAFVFAPDRGIGVVILVNAIVPVVDTALAALDLFLDLPAEPPVDHHTSPRTWTDYVGTYDDPYGALGRFKVTLDGSKLLMTLLGGQRATIDVKALHGVFWRDASGKVQYFVTRVGVARRH
jgi:CubicO group peptidase (beta-lactamase class C family)